MPPLRDRASDIPVIALHFLKKYATENGKTIQGFADDALLRLSGYHWPGNVRELENVVERACVLCGGPQITVAELPPHVVAGDDRAGIRIPGSTLAEIEHYAIRKTLAATGGSTTKTAEMLGISVRKIQYKQRELEGAPEGAPAPPTQAS
jgi:DNA-binding NtrC family response regulator